MSTTTHTLIFALHFSTPINQLHAFEIGTNKKRINEEHIQQEVARNIPNRIEQLKKILREAEKTKPREELKINLAIPSYVLELIIKNHPQTYKQLKELVHEYPIQFLLTTYYSSALRTLSKKELALQLRAEKQLLKKYFNTKAQYFFTNDHHLNKEINAALGQQKVKGILFAHEGASAIVHYTNTRIPCFDKAKENKENEINQYEINKNENTQNENTQKNSNQKGMDFKEQTTNEINQEENNRNKNNFVKQSSSKQNIQTHIYSLLNIANNETQKEILQLLTTSATANCEELFASTTAPLVLKDKKDFETYSTMEERLMTELKRIHPHIEATGDAQLMEEWRFLANKELIQKANPELASQEHSPYEYFANFMNILNDFAHTIRTVEAVHNGEPQPQMELRASPVELLQEQKLQLQKEQEQKNLL